MSVLVIDVGTSGLRTAVISSRGVLAHLVSERCTPSSPAPGLVEFDGGLMAALVQRCVAATLDSHRHSGDEALTSVGITTQRASTLLWDRATGEAVGPGLSWQDLRTVFDCIVANDQHGLGLAPNQSATKLAWLLNLADPARTRDLAFGTVDTWIAWVLSGGRLHITDHSNAAVTGLYDLDAADWSSSACELLNIPMGVLPTIGDTTGMLGATEVAGGLPLCALVGDQQASLVGQGCVTPGATKITFGSGGMLDMCTGSTPPPGETRRVGMFPDRRLEPQWGTDLRDRSGDALRWIECRLAP